MVTPDLRTRAGRAIRQPEGPYLDLFADVSEIEGDGTAAQATE
jgi:hypothetical protein